MKNKQEVSNNIVAVLLIVIIIATVAGTWLVLESKLSSVPESKPATGNVKLSVHDGGPIPVMQDYEAGNIALLVQ